MGCCLSKANPSSCPPSSPVKPPNLPTQSKTELKKSDEEEQLEILGLNNKEGVNDSGSDGLTRPAESPNPVTDNPQTPRKEETLANCSKEEVEAILIQCGRLSRSSSATTRRYSGSKRSHDFDNASIVELNFDDNNESRSNGPLSQKPVRRRSHSPITSRTRNGGNVKKRVSRVSSRSRSPAMSRKDEFSPLRRTPLTGLDINSLPFNPLSKKFGSLKDPIPIPIPLCVVSSQLKEEDLNPATSYKYSLILQDIRNFHQKASPSKNCSIVESVADLNSCNRPKPPCTSSVIIGARTSLERPKDELNEARLDKYVTVRKRGVGEFDELEESSGSNSFIAGSQSKRLSSSCSSSSDCRTSGRSREDGLLPVSFQRLAVSEDVA